MNWSDDSSMSKTVRLIEIVLLVGGLIWAAAFLRADVNKNTQRNEKQDKQLEYFQEQVRKTYVRQDVLGPQIQQIRNQLDRIEKKIDN